MGSKSFNSNITAPVSIVIPVLNEAMTLPNLFKGLENQNLLPEELVFVDAGSADGSSELIAEWWELNRWEKGECRVILRQGAFPGAARNAGIETARSEWIAFLDAGVVPAPDWLNALFNYARLHKIKGVFGVCRFMGESAIERAFCALSYGYKAIHSVLPASLFHRDIFRQVGLFKPDLRSAEDIYWIKEYLKIYSPKEICAEAEVTYRNFPDSASAGIKKWYVYGLNTAKAGVFKKQQLFYFLIFGILTVSFAHKFLLGASMLTVYAITRGVIIPIKKSGTWHWWKGNFSAFMVAAFLGVLLDTAKTVGLLAGHTNRLIKLVYS
ncbi:MAG: glycosyltransferase family 2 protein [Nitrospirae bacterium]|nr:glycosyltransferase family 2 protein [Nitrospirota bacterium]